ncbi:MAG: D-alanyl-D-alanine carboxypeptidase/D-alanyl-D-alanine-endopeptidase [Ignavibacteriaceae bacterium]|jgi:D-alanyl-D-alanine carboxypeptidase/D-alanyl-D-alanine-endopeptidase (penicillin-binding protein 4)|nr:D-alanyl-D-alanine carboxypeptidase/D-alanyl-D-alanine-endopeptidase [Ignavibacteriaceae bacterium]MCU0414028.1 D-alanyl-D-alanine carboxypeptidase/D-alanyl-D-alanine-endopeptidase [Ignavibacteriaceae bacterium]
MKILATLFLVIFSLNNLLAEEPDKIIKEIDELILDIPAGTKMAIMIYNPLTQDTLVSINHTETMIPASNTKLFTSAAALELLGGDYPLSTKILADDDDISDGTIEGNIYIKGFGNPTFTTEDLEKLINQLYQSGLRKVTGNVIGDDTYFDNVYSRDDWISEEHANVKLPPISALVIDRNRTIISKKRKGRYRNYFVNVENPPLFAAKTFREKLISYGVEVTGNSLSGQADENAKPLLDSSIKLRELLQIINKHSDNFYAECLFKTLGSAYSGQQGNSFFSTQAILNFIEDNSIYSIGTKIVDGSGISRFDQVTAGALVGLLEKVYFNFKQFDDFFNSLSIAGVDGTLRKRMIGTPAENNFRGKTGTLNGVSSIAGYVTTADDDDIIVCIMFEYTKGGTSKYKSIQDGIIEILAGWKN